MIADILITVASLGFVFADMNQALKLFHKKGDDCSIISTWHYRFKVLSLIIILIAYGLLGLPFAFIVALTQILLNVYIMTHVDRYMTLLVKKGGKGCARSILRTS